MRRRVRMIGEFLSGYLKRLEGADDQRIRVGSDTSDNKGNVIVQPVLILGRDPNDDIRPAKMDTEGRLDIVGVCPEHQPDAVMTQINPISGTRYEVLATTELVRLITLYAEVAWTVQPTPLEVWITIDGNIIRHLRANPVSTTNYFAQLAPWETENIQQLVTGPAEVARQAFYLEGRSVRVEVETTGGTVSELHSRVKWAKW